MKRILNYVNKSISLKNKLMQKTSLSKKGIRILSILRNSCKFLTKTNRKNKINVLPSGKNFASSMKSSGELREPKETYYWS